MSLSILDREGRGRYGVPLHSMATRPELKVLVTAKATFYDQLLHPWTHHYQNYASSLGNHSLRMEMLPICDVKWFSYQRENDT